MGKSLVKRWYRGHVHDRSNPDNTRRIFAIGSESREGYVLLLLIRVDRNFVVMIIPRGEDLLSTHRPQTLRATLAS